MLFVAEAPGQREAAEGKPLVGEAGAMFQRLLGMLGRKREEFRLASTLCCRPPRNWREGEPWEDAALNHCRPNLDAVLSEGSNVVISLGGVALRSLLGVGKRAKGTIKEYHGAVTKDMLGRFWMSHTFHPSHLQRGAHNLTGVVLWDIRRALKVAAEGFTPDEPELVVDPTLEWFSAWVDDYLTRAEEVWLAVDTEFPGKTVQEDEQTPDASWNLTRVNLAWHPDLGVTVPADPPYMRLVAKALASPGVKVFWHHRVDTGRLAVAGAPVSGPIWDAMDATHVLQSDIPRSLGFWAPFYSDAAPWKHENAENPGPYAAKDAAQTLRIMHGAAAHLQQEGQWEVFERHFALFDQWVTVPAETVGLLVDPEELPRFTQRLLDEETRLEGLQKPLVPPELGLTHTWKRRPETDDQGRAQVDGEWYPLQETVVTELVRACLTCGAKEVVPKHRCKTPEGKPDKNAKPQVELVELPVTRWWVQLPFNPQSPPQMLQLLATWKLAPGKDKKTGRPSANKECLVRCRKSAKRPEQREFFGYELDRRAVAKVEGTYASGTIRRLREQELRGVVDGRLHSSFPNKPSTFRLSSVDPNLQNVKADKAGGGERPEAGFRRCIVAAPGCSLAELDWAAIEAVMVAWFAGDPVYYRLAKLGVHAYMASHALGRPADLAWDDDKLAAYFKEIKGSDDPKVSRTYNACKRTVHGCVPGDHEVLTPGGWIRFDQLQEGTKVAQWKNGELDFVVPTITKLNLPAEELIEFSGRGLQIQMTPWHRVPVRNSGGKLVDWEAQAVPGSGDIPVSGIYTGGINQWNPFLALSVAIQADGSLYKRRAVFHLTRRRKVERLRELVAAAESSGFSLNYTEVPCGCHAGWRVRLTLPNWAQEDARYSLIGADKHFYLPALLSLTSDARTAFLAEILHWDGTRPGVLKWYLNTSKEDCLAVQTVAHLTGRQGLLRELNPGDGHLGKNLCYKVSLNRRQYASVECLERTTLPAAPRTVYCVTVPSSYFLVRWNNTISVTGNTSYGLTPYGMNERMPDLFPTIKVATWYQDLFFSLAPKVRAWQRAVQERAAKERSLGGPGAHPFGYKFWFWDVFSYRKITAAQAQGIKARGGWVTEFNGTWYLRGLGTDAKRVVATMPQSGAAGVMRETCLRLFVPGGPSYIGDAWYGQTPLRAIIHDSLLLELPDETKDQIITTVAREMTAPITQMPLPEEWGFGPYVTLGVDIKVGKNWGEMEKWKPSQAPVEVAVDTGVVEYEEEEGE